MGNFGGREYDGLCQCFLGRRSDLCAGTDIDGKDKTPVRAYKCTAEKVMLEYADKRYFIFNGTVVIHADLSQDVFLI